MESRFIFQDAMDIDPADFNTVQDYTQQSFDHIVADAITSDRKYAEFTVTQVGATSINVAPGRFYSGGKVYNRDTAFTADFATNLPVATKRIVTIAVYASEVDTDAVPREFLLNEDTGASEPRVVAVEHARVANINAVLGVESADPTPQLLDAAVMAIAQILLTPAGIASITMVTDNLLDSAQSLAERVGDLEKFEATAAPQIVSLGSDLAALKVGASGNVTQEVYGRMLARVAVLESNAGIPATAQDSDADFFLDASKSDLTFSGSNCSVEEGIRFADNAVANSELQLLNPLDTGASLRNGLLLPAYDRTLRLNSGPKASDTQISAYTYTTHEMVQKTMTRTRVRYGPEFTVCSNSAWWQSGQYNYNQQTFAKDGETFNVDAYVVGGYNNMGAGHDLVRLQEYWYDTVEEIYWADVQVQQAVPGAQVAQTFLNANDMWLDAVGLTFTKLAQTGGITLALCEVDRGMPDLQNVISFTSVDRSSLVLNAETVIPIQPVFLSGGKRYAIVVITPADHWIATTQGANFPGGTFFYVLDGAYQQGDGTRDVCFSLYAAKFRASRAIIQMQPLSLAGGIAAIDILAPSIVPDSANLTYEIQVNGQWIAVAAAQDGAVLGAGGSIPPLLPLRAIFTGTQDVMPCVTLTGSRARVSCPKTALTHISKVRTLPGSSTSIRVIERLEAFNAAHHTAAAKLLTGASYGTVVTPSSTVDVTNDDGTIERTSLFNLGAAVSTYRIRTDATTDSALNTFHFGWRKDYAL
jgi:hypothetical protein